MLFALQEPGYFRFYGPAIVELARRGWDIALVYGKPDRRGPGLAVPANAGDRVRSLGQLPGDASPFATTLRTTLDAVRYLEPAFSRTEYLRRRAEEKLPSSLDFLRRIRQLPRSVVTGAIALGRAIERLLPVNRDVLSFVREVDPDVVVISPLVILGSQGAHATELIKAAGALGIPSVVGVASWDHLTSKGLIRIVPDVVIVWNDIQAQEAEYLHRIPRRRLVITGAQSLDRWFESPSDSAVRAFRRELGIDENQRVLLWVGSSANMAPGDSEVHFVRRWLASIRASQTSEVRNAFVIVRPHPGNVEPWQQVDLADDHAVVHPTAYPSGVLFSTPEVDTFRYSLLASSAVVGINTTAMIEAAIVRRPVFSIRDSAFTHSQDQTLHFGYLSATQGGCVSVSESVSDHVVQLERAITAGADMTASDRFVSRFVRPRGMATSATIQLCDALERVAAPRGGAPAGVDTIPAGTSDAVSGGR
jgi:hypothetical protein